MKKIDTARELMRQTEGMLACPHCRGRLAVSADGSLRCPAGHSFDLARQGYANLLTGAPPEEYGTDMLLSRRLVIEGGLFDLLMEELAGLLHMHASEMGQAALRLLDAGSGEGSPLSGVASRIAAQGTAVQAAGVDISRDGVRLAASRYDGVVWCVGDIANLPFGEGKFDAVLNILSPSNYAEFARVLAPAGVLIKVVPGADYLTELRRALYAGGEREQYTNEPVVRHFREQFADTQERHLRYTWEIPPGLAEHLAAMTPMTWNASSEAVARAVQAMGGSVTLEFSILIGKAGEGSE